MGRGERVGRELIKNIHSITVAGGWIRNNKAFFVRSVGFSSHAQLPSATIAIHQQNRSIKMQIKKENSNYEVSIQWGYNR